MLGDHTPIAIAERLEVSKPIIAAHIASLEEIESAIGADEFERLVALLDQANDILKTCGMNFQL